MTPPLTGIIIIIYMYMYIGWFRGMEREGGEHGREDEGWTDIICKELNCIDRLFLSWNHEILISIW